MTSVNLESAPGAYRASLSCVDANLEVLLGHHGVPDVLTVLGGLCVLDTEPGGTVTTRPTPVDRWVRHCTGLELRQSEAPDVETVFRLARSAVDERAPVLVTVDAHSVPWSPYQGREHHEHAFVIDGYEAPDDGGDGIPRRVHVVDAYTNATRHGAADPQELWMDTERLRTTLTAHGDAFGVARLEGERQCVADSAIRALETVWLNTRAHERTVEAGRDSRGLACHDWEQETAEGLQWLSLATWLATRNRGLHAQWWDRMHASRAPGKPGPVAEAGHEAAHSWQQAQKAVYLAWRRVEAGRACPPTLKTSLTVAADAEERWFAAMYTWLRTLGETPA
ncbi:hypothetical protein [Streptomyces sp. 8N706]|uniref:hypothetical protein n=1 Tax=Streptomyces sp. 8N706 TaxID=3457416 RepID=UPI003FD307DE